MIRQSQNRQLKTFKNIGYKLHSVVSVPLFFWDSISRTGKTRNRKVPFCAYKRWFLAKTSRNIFLIYPWKNRLILMVFPSGGVFQHLTSHSFHLLALFKRESSEIFQSASSYNAEVWQGVASGHDFRQKTLCERGTTNTFTWNWYAAVLLFCTLLVWKQANALADMLN